VVALDRLSHHSTLSMSEVNKALSGVSLRPLSLTRLLGERDQFDIFPFLALSLRRTSFWFPGSERWSEAMLLAQFSDLPIAITGHPAQDFKASPSAMIQRAHEASQGGDLDDLIKLCMKMQFDRTNPFALPTAYDTCRILVKTKEHFTVEVGAKWTRNYFEIDKPRQISLIMIAENTIHGCFTKTLVAALTAQDRVDEAQLVLLDAHKSAREAFKDDDTLNQLHLDMLTIRFYRQWRLDLPSRLDQYETYLRERSNRMYASDWSQLLKAEGLAMGCIFRKQDELNEAIEIVALFVSNSTDILGKDHPLTLRAKRVLDATIVESKQEAILEKNDDCWFRFGSMTFQRDATTLGCWETYQDSADSLIAVHAISWQKIASAQRKRSRKAYG
jgi:hypothetical protein